MSRLRAIVLGSAAGGGFPQWNCRCPVCQLAWDGDPRVQARTQASLAVSRDGERWLLLNASPDLRAQILATPALRPGVSDGHEQVRSSPIAAVLLTGAEIDQAAGLLHLRERQPFALYATATTLATLADNPMFEVLATDLVMRRAMKTNETVSVAGLEIAAFAVPGKVPLYLEDEGPVTAQESEATIGLELSADGARMLFVPGAAAVTPALRARMTRADVVLFDGTLFTDDEMIRSSSGNKSGLRMGHVPIDGPDGSLAALRNLRARRIYVHINNTNPILIAGSPERRRVEAGGVEVATDGMEIVL